MSIRELSYPDFVGFLGQKNTPPGGAFTLKRTIDLAKITKTSHLLDLACSTGFSSREIAKQVGSSSVGIDLSETSISSAIQSAEKENLSHLLSYQVARAEELPFKDDCFSHIVSGCNFSFIQRRKEALKECARVLQKGGSLAVANFYYESKPTEEILDKVDAAIGFRPEREWSRNWWLSFFETYFSLHTEEIYDLPVEQTSELEKAIHNVIYQNEALADLSEDVKKESFQRLFEIRKVLNEHRKYQKFNISIWCPHDKS